MLSPASLMLLVGVVTASPTRIPGLMRRAISPSVCANMSFVGDSALPAVVPAGAPLFYLASKLQSVYEFDGGYNQFSNEEFCGIANDTCLFVFNGTGTCASFDNVKMTKFGFDSDLNQASFFGVNAVVNVQNGSSLTVNQLNMTAHNGAAGLYSYGTGTTINVSDSSFYGTGPVSHGLYASGNGSIAATNFYCENYAIRSSCLSGDNPAGYLYVNDSQVYMYGLGSAVAYTVGETHLNNVTGFTNISFALIADGAQLIDVQNSDIEGGYNFATVQLFSSQPIVNGTYKSGSATLVNTHLRSHGATHPMIGFSNVNGTIYATNLTVTSESGILAVSNSSGITQDFDHYRNEDQGASADPAIGYLYLKSSCAVSGSVSAINGSALTVSLEDSTTWTGYSVQDSNPNPATVAIIIDSTSTWNVSAASAVQELVIDGDDLSRIQSNGFNITYNSTASANAWLSGAVQSLTGGGSLTPA